MNDSVQGLSDTQKQKKNQKKTTAFFPKNKTKD
jgi:hypothetical protein